MRSECTASRIVFIACFSWLAESRDSRRMASSNFALPRSRPTSLDGRAISEASKHPSLSLSAGEHKVELVNYGYQPVTRTVTITAGKTTNLEVALEAVAAKVSGPFGAIAIEGADRDAVLLNGKTPDFFVGHGDEFNTDFLWWKQELVVPPGTYQVSIQSGDKDVWSGPVDVPVNQRVIVDASKGVRKTVPWSRGEKLGTAPRFKAGVASATVAVAKPTAELAATTAQLNCGDSSNSSGTPPTHHRLKSNRLERSWPPESRGFSPSRRPTYDLTALGPGGTATSSVTVNVNSAIQANLSLSSAETHYKSAWETRWSRTALPR